MKEDDQQETIVSDLYDNYHETQKEVMAIEIRKTRNKLFTLAIFLFCVSMVALFQMDAVTFQNVLIVSIEPILFLGMGLLAIKEPMVAMLITAIIIGGLWIYSAVQTNGVSLISGWILKVVVVYLVIAGIQHAREAQRIRKELKL